METKLLSFKDSRCIEILLNEEVLAFPTETVFGFGIVFDSKEAFSKLCLLKQRNPDKPFTIMVSKKEHIERFVNLNDKMRKLISKFMPGELTIIFTAKDNLDEHLTLNQGTVGIRIPNDKGVLDLIDRVNKPLLVTSANISNQAPLLNSEDVYKQFNNKLYGIVGGVCVSNIPSTIIKIDEDNISLIRQGGIPFEDILKEWNV